MRLHKFSRGDVVIKSVPFAAVLQPRLAGRYCDECFKEIRRPFVARCPNCPFVSYCSFQCEAEHLSFHSVVECALLSAFVPETPDVTIRLFAKLIYRVQGEKFDLFKERLFNGATRTFDDLLDHRERICKAPAMFTRFRTYLSFVEETFPENLKLNSDRLLSVFGKMMINRFSVQNNYLEPIGEALYIGPSIHDHSCLPDANYTFNGTELTVRTMRNMTVVDPRQIYICYTEILQPLDDRISFLEEHYFFRCQCSLCSQPDHPVNRIKAKIFIEEDDEHERQSGQVLLKYWKIDAMAVAFECALHLNLKEQAFEYGNRLLEFHRMTHGEHRPCCSILSLRVGEVADCKGRHTYENAMNYARKLLMLTHGADHPMSVRANVSK